MEALKSVHGGKRKWTQREEEVELPGEERNEFVTVSRESVFNSVSDTGNPTKLWLRRHNDHYVYMSVKFFLISCKNCQSEFGVCKWKKAWEFVTCCVDHKSWVYIVQRKTGKTVCVAIIHYFPPYYCRLMNRIYVFVPIT